MVESNESATGVSPEEERFEAILRESDLNDEEAQALRSFTRLLVGGTLVGWDELLHHLQVWEEESRGTLAEQMAEEGEVIDADAAGSEGSITLTPRVGRPAEELRYILIGLLFESQSRWIKRSATALDLAGQMTEATLSPLLRWMNGNRRLQPARDRFDSLVSRGESVVGRWARRGRIEEARSRRLVETASQETFTYSMDQLGQAPALQDLVRKQSAGLTEDVLDEMRSRTVSGDMLAERLARRLLRRAPRSMLPKPLVTAEPDQPGED